MKKNFFYRFLLLLLILGFFSQITLPARAAHASSWTDNARNETGIYGERGDESDSEMPEEDEPGFLVKFIIELLVNLGTGCEVLFNTAGLSLDNIVYGRVNGNDVDGVALFTFELTENNPYGLVSAALYQIFRMISYASIAVIIAWKLSISSYVKMTPQNLEKVKSSGLHMLLSFLLLALTPYLLDVVLYLRDVVLYFVSTTAASFLFGNEGSSFSLTGMFREHASGSITGAIVYIAATFYSLYLGFMYIGYAMSFLVCFASFPLVVMASNLKRDLLKNWISTVSYFVCIPVLDAALLFVPAFMIKIDAAPLITLLACMCITQARGILSQLLGIQDRSGGVMGMAAMLAVGRMMGSVAQAGRTAIGQYKGAKSDKNMADYEDAMAAATGESGGSIASYNAGTGNMSTLTAQEAGIESSPGHISPENMSIATGSNNVTVAGDVTHSASNIASVTDFKKATPSTQSGFSAIADRYANIDNFESGPLNNQISHTKRAALYRERARHREKKALGTLVGGSFGGIFGGAAGLMTGPAGAAMGAAAGTSMGSQAGAVLFDIDFNKAGAALGKGIGRASATLNGINTTIAGNGVGAVVNTAVSDITGLTPYADGTVVSISPVEQVSGEVDNIYDLPATVTRTSVSADIADNISSSTLGIDSVSQQSIINHVYANAKSVKECADFLNNKYTDNAQVIMEPILNEMKTQNAFYGMSREEARESFRNHVHEQYMSEFNQRYDNHPARVFSNDDILENSTKTAMSNFIRYKTFDKNNSASFISDEALDSYSWFNL